MPRKTQKQGKKKRLLILSDGESELIYLKLLTSEYNTPKKLAYINNKAFKNLEEITKELKKLIKNYKGKNLPYEEIHIICDKEMLSNKSRQKSYQNLVNQKKDIQKNAPLTTIEIIDSFPTFEFFLILHFEKIKNFKKLHSDRDLNDILSNQYTQKYKKADDKWLKNTIFNKNVKKNIVRAIERSSKINTYTDNNSWSKLEKTVKQIIINSI